MSRYFKVVERSDEAREEMLYKVNEEVDVVYFWSVRDETWWPSAVPSATFFLDELTKEHTLRDLEVTEIDEFDGAVVE